LINLPKATPTTMPKIASMLVRGFFNSGSIEKQPYVTIAATIKAAKSFQLNLGHGRGPQSQEIVINPEEIIQPTSKTPINSSF
jgi:hypothetical protein